MAISWRAQTLEDALTILFFIVRRPRILVGHAVPQGIVKEHRQFARRGRDGLGFAHAGSEASVERPERRLRFARR